MDNVLVKIFLRNLKREPEFRVEVDHVKPPSIVRNPEDASREIYLNWDQAIDDHGTLRRCPVCGCRELFARKDFPQVTGFAIVVLAAIVSLIMLQFDHIMWALAVLGVVVAIDAAVFLFTGKCLVCYRCRSEFRDVSIPDDHPAWDLSTGEKYQIRNDSGQPDRPGK